MTSELPAGFSTALRGTSREFRESSTQIYATFGLALLVIYLVLAAQFESFLHPLTVLLSVPLAALGALAALWITGQTINLYSQIGMILLIGLVTKNAILLVDFANQERARGTELLEALRRAGHTSFGPILMTSATSILGALPLALAGGAGAESRDDRSPSARHAAAEAARRLASGAKPPQARCGDARHHRLAARVLPGCRAQSANRALDRRL